MPRTPASRFLAPNPGSTRPYVAKPLRDFPDVADDPETIARIATHTDIRDEPESIGPAVADYVKIATKYDTLRRLATIEQLEKAREDLSMEQRMVDARHAARAQRVDISGELYVIGRMLDRARNGGRAEPPAAVARLAKVEARLDCKPERPDLAA